MTIRSHFAPLLGAMSLGLALTAQAAPVLDQSQTTFTYGSAGYISDTSLAGQSFTVGQSGLLSGVSIYINGFMQGTNTVALRVHSGATLFSGTVLGSASYDVNTSLYNTVTDEFMMDVSSLGIQVSAGEVLNFDIGITGSGDLASSRGILWTASDAYAGGSGSFQLSWFDSQFPNADLTFRTYVDADAGSNVPEPTSLALVGLALGAGSLLRRRVA